jgi:hypothetical protein
MGPVTGGGRHRLAEERSLALHGAVAARLGSDASVAERARTRIREWTARGAMAPEYGEAWLRLLDGPREELLAVLSGRDERARALRQASPFSFVLEPRERWRLWRLVGERFRGAAG